MTTTEAFLILHVPQDAKTILEKDIIPELKRNVIENIMLVEENAEKETEFSFKYNNDSPVLNFISAQLIAMGCTIQRLLVHLSPDVSGIRDVYDASAKGFVIQDVLRNIGGVKVATTSNNGTVRIEIDTAAKDYDIIIGNAINAIMNI